ncbi:GcrA family cell cycle regulator [Bradyrhizobium ottawaense]|uniref:GcrA family cell cycle regulator n=1 Tax=Bradyrhizobium ottawaense TaxID=931866 RepID=UPI002714EE99|nr:GcrA family cell cycle regulator [Bradyrhizobium ottawaense]WLB49211.1 GcrA family cell cycle regulator [Bradyrhizobium ottawaense]
MSWSDEQITKLRALHSEGMSFALIAEQIGHTRNSCIGKARRLELPMRVTLKSKKGEPKPKSDKRRYFSIVRAAAKGNKLHVIETVQTDLPLFKCDVLPLNKCLDDLLAGDCRYVTNDPRDGARYCGHPAHKRSYCRTHFDACYVEPQKRWGAPSSTGYRDRSTSAANHLESAA